ncbi:hypothetical protein [Dyadobacter sp. CY326]|uniref:hypothetical protein n=1 Tax=Dyadobacter sp. CY326 TaxID=2907300 RepID=UPI001F170376|nr:hypothetical protein [Dyadobacter sp. CY326]MCE7064942.1 hypothetical protein [Dyadobacter sp. CY326]
MKSFIRNIILTIVILDTTSLYQVMKAPTLVRHFLEHKSLDQKVSFVDFLSMHYWGEDLDDDDDEKDMQLPFKKIEIHHANFLFFSHTETFTFTARTQPEIKSHYGPDQPQIAYSTILGSLFRPPRV